MTDPLFPVLETPRLILREPVPSDAAQVLAIRGDARQMRYIPRPVIATEDEALSLIGLMHDTRLRGERLNWAVRTRDDDRCIGIVGYVRFVPEHFRAEIGYIFHEAHNGRGYAQEAVAAAMEYGFAHRSLHMIEAVIRPDNQPSRTLAERCGFRLEAHFRDFVYFDGAFHDELFYCCSEEDLRRSGYRLKYTSTGK